MNDILNKSIVLVLNRNWQAINIRTPQEAFCQMATNVATALQLAGHNKIRPWRWTAGIVLRTREAETAVEIVAGRARLPRLIAPLTFPRVPNTAPTDDAK